MQKRTEWRIRLCHLLEMSDLMCAVDKMSSFSEETVNSGGNDHSLELSLLAGGT